MGSGIKQGGSCRQWDADLASSPEDTEGGPDRPDVSRLTVVPRRQGTATIMAPTRLPVNEARPAGYDEVISGTDGISALSIWC